MTIKSKQLPTYIKLNILSGSLFVHLRDNTKIDDIQVMPLYEKSASVGLKNGKIVYIRIPLAPEQLKYFDDELKEKEGTNEYED